jgi:TolB-like protein/tetratricopeptide (TPR) repeat protein
MATGKPAFSGTQETTVDAILTREPASPRSLNDLVPSELEQIVARALRKNRELRYQSAAEVKADLLRIEERSPRSGVATDSGPILRGFRHKASTLTLGIILAGILAAALWRARERPPLAKGSNPPVVRSLAVLPLENQTGDAGQEFYVDGMTDALITRLAQVSGLQVTSMQSVLRYKTEKKPLPTIARELGVGTVVTGSVARSGNRVHIHAQLVDAASGRRLWSRSYARDLSEVSVLQSEIASSIAEEIKTKMTPQEQARLANARAVNPAAYEAYLQGRFLVSRHSVEEATKALKYFQHAIDIDPDYAPAYAGLCDSYETISQFGSPKPEVWEKGKAVANRALELDDTLAEAHRCRATGLLRHEWDWVESEKEYQRALQLNPGDPDTYGEYGVALGRMGRTNEAIAMTKRAFELDPLSAQSAVTVAVSYYNGRQYDRAIEQARRAVELDPTFIQGHRWLGLGYAAKGKFPEAIDEFKLTVKLSPGNLSYLTNLARLYAWAGKLTEARQALAQVKDLSKTQFISAWAIAMVYTALGDKDEAFAWMDKAYEERSGWLLTLRVNPWLDPLRSDPRFDELVRRVEAAAKLTPISKDESQIQH